MVHNKYHSRVCYYNPVINLECEKGKKGAIRFDSCLEMRTYQQLIKSWHPLSIIRQYKFVLIHPKNGHQGISYIADFVLLDENSNIKVVVEAKGLLTTIAEIKLKLLEQFYPQNYDTLIIAVDNFRTITQQWINPLLWNINRPLSQSTGFKRAIYNFQTKQKKGA